MGWLETAFDSLYQRAVMEPSSIDDAELAAWLEEAAFGIDGRMDKAAARAMRKAARNARRIARYWSDPERDPAELPDWRNGVDEILGAAGWRPHLDAARAELEAGPSPETYEAVKHWFRAVHFTEWMEGVGYDEWLSFRDD